ncbi:CPBP family intramembrane glutamic endopeptidase [Staphylococcus lutrae]|uniref:CAAX prenyl protease 2/Lysostaphin resistance protein A-like domain-containing protein n=1 Tax=Staphylococcus lutrae TaxID=155085 RepID=A0AAC9RUD1_9STAP|nr:hypothetical protein B5P37_07230 [Staphylococcus lutrae]
MICIFISPLVEKLIFRKYLWSFLNRIFNQKRVTALFSSIVFALLHLSEYILPLIGTGLIFCWLYHKTGKIINNIILHSSYNLTLLVMYQIFVSYL